MKLTQREFRIAAAAALFGFFLCYFLIGGDTPARLPQLKMQAIATLTRTNEVTHHIWTQPGRTNAPQLPSSPASYTYVTGPFGALKPPRMDLFSSRYKVEVDLNDLQ